MIGLLLAQAATLDDQAADALFKGGPFAIVVACAIFGYVRFKPELDTLRADKARAESQYDALVKQYDDVVIPTLRDAFTAMTSATGAIERSTEAIHRAEDSYRTLGQTIVSISHSGRR